MYLLQVIRCLQKRSHKASQLTQNLSNPPAAQSLRLSRWEHKALCARRHSANYKEKTSSVLKLPPTKGIDQATGFVASALRLRDLAQYVLYLSLTVY
ncbi:hypothetical protein JZ751_020580 [Albula glossodonta]|uniref:Uncharacterized protein n=1 Tax=Albula glossodonta TaxID=121402 RepID=A0A8T2PNM8_9TELE|nr:hypothetical protein JZ751_020580 [Albula glossodonta]